LSAVSAGPIAKNAIGAGAFLFCGNTSMRQIITPRSARKSARRDEQLFAKAQIDKIREHLAGIIQKHETPAHCVKRLVEALKQRGEGCEAPAQVAANWGP
jgi:hypothetical protein